MCLAMRLFFTLTAIALGIAALSGAPLGWDGSYRLFKILDAQGLAFAETQYRLTPLLLHLPVFLASQLTDDVAVLRALFSLAYAAVPLAALVASWWIVRPTHLHLMLW